MSGVSSSVRGCAQMTTIETFLLRCHSSCSWIALSIVSGCAELSGLMLPLCALPHPRICIVLNLPLSLQILMSCVVDKELFTCICALQKYKKRAH